MSSTDCESSTNGSAFIFLFVRLIGRLNAPLGDVVVRPRLLELCYGLPTYTDGGVVADVSAFVGTDLGLLTAGLKSARKVTFDNNLCVLV